MVVSTSPSDVVAVALAPPAGGNDVMVLYTNTRNGRNMRRVGHNWTPRNLF